jgi:hypothetical protein
VTLIIRHPAELHRLLDSGEPRVVFEIPGLTKAENAALHARLGRLYEECGCKHATIALLLGAAITAALGIAASVVWWRTGLAALVVGSCFSLIAKASARRLARFRLRRAVAREIDGGLANLRRA